MADQKWHTVRVKFDLPKGTAGGPGMYVEVNVPDGSVPVRTQPAVPAESLIWRGNLPSVFIISDGKPSLRFARVGYPLPDGRISVVSGLNGEEMGPSLVKLNDKIQSNLDRIPLGVSQSLIKPKGVDDVLIVTLTLWSHEVDEAALRTLGLDATRFVPVRWN